MSLNPIEEICFKCLSEIILKLAAYFHLQYADTEDCRITFISKMMRTNGCILAACNETCANANEHSLATYAFNHLIDYTRPILRRNKHETSLEEYGAKNGDIVPRNPSDQPSNPEEELCRRDFMEHVNVALKGLTNKEIDVLVRRCYFDQPIREIADALRTTEEAADQTLRRARRCLRKILRAKGYIIPGG